MRHQSAFLKEFHKGFHKVNSAMRKTNNANYWYNQVKLLEPNDGEVVRFQILTEDKDFLSLCVSKITELAQIFSAGITVSDKIVVLKFKESSAADALRKAWSF
jgi:hypothetical protein